MAGKKKACPKCSASLPETANFCGSCGHSFLRKQKQRSLLDPATGRVKSKVEKPAAKPKPVAKKPKKPPSKGHAATPKDIEIIERRNKILDLRTQGASIRQISEQLRAKGENGASVARVHQLLVDALEDLHVKQSIKTHHHVQLELIKLDRKELALFGNLVRLADLDSSLLKDISQAAKSDDASFLLTLLKKGFNADEIEKYSRSIERIWKYRSSLLGLAKPTKHEHTGEDGKPIETSLVTRVILPAAVEQAGEEE